MPEGGGAEAGRVSVERLTAVTDRSATGISEVSQFRPSPTYSRGRGHSPPRSALLRTVQDSRAQHITNARAQTPRSSPDTHVCVSVTLLASPARPAQPSQAAALAARHRSFPLRILLGNRQRQRPDSHRPAGIPVPTFVICKTRFNSCAPGHGSQGTTRSGKLSQSRLAARARGARRGRAHVPRPAIVRSSRRFHSGAFAIEMAS